MRTVLTAAAFVLSASAVPAFAKASDSPPAAVVAAAPVDPASLAIANDIVAHAFPSDKREQMMSSILDSLVAQTRQAMAKRQLTSDKEFQALLDRSTQRMFDTMKAVITPQIPDVFDSMAHAYARMFTQDELTQILAFVKTPAGQHYFQQSAQILKDPDVQAANQRLAAKLLEKLPEVQAQTMQDVEDYVAKMEKQAKSNRATHAS